MFGACCEANLLLRLASPWLHRAGSATSVTKQTGAPRGSREGLNPGRWAHAPGGVGTWALSRVWHRFDSGHEKLPGGGRIAAR